MEKLIATLFLAREIAHREHLKTRSYAQHMALGSFYEDIVGKADALAEAWQGRFGLLKDIPFMVGNISGSIVDILQGHVDWIAKERYNICPSKESAIQNIIDEVVGVYLSTLYKLKFLS